MTAVGADRCRRVPLTPFAIVLVAGGLLAQAAAAGAQPANRLGLGGGIEYANITEDDGFLGDGLGWTANVEWRWTRNTAVEFELSRERHVREGRAGTVFAQSDGSLVPYSFTWRWEGTATFLFGTVTRTFGAWRVRPLLFGGGGLMRHPGTMSITTDFSPSGEPFALPPDVPAPEAEAAPDPGARLYHRGRGATAAAIEGGGGLAVRAGERLVVRPYAALRLATTGNYGPKYIIRSGLRVMVLW